MSEAAEARKPGIFAIGANDTPIWCMSPIERLRRLAGKAGLPLVSETAAYPKLLVNLDYAIDPSLLTYMASEPDRILTDEVHVPVIAHVSDEERAASASIIQAMVNRLPLPDGSRLEKIAYGPGFTMYNHELRKREQPFLMVLNRETRPAIERASYFAAYKGVTDVLTKYLWPELALLLTKLAARIGATPNMVTAVGAMFCVLAAYLFWQGAFWSGMAAGLVFMVLDTVDGKLARCTITSSKWGNIFDHGIDQVHPPFWWWAWGAGLGHWGLAFKPTHFALIMAVIIGGYLVQRTIEGAFMRIFGMHIHVWERVDSQFRLVTARRNPNMVILFASLLFGRPDVGLLLLVAWTIVSCVFHGVRLTQAMRRRSRGQEIRSWIS